MILMMMMVAGGGDECLERLGWECRVCTNQKRSLA